MTAFPMEKKEHVVNGGPCWCGPAVEGPIVKHDTEGAR